MERDSDKKNLDNKRNKNFFDKVFNRSQKSIDRFGKLSIALASVFLVILISVAVVLTVGSKFTPNNTQNSNNSNSTNSTEDYSNQTTNNSSDNSNQTVNNQNGNSVNDNSAKNDSVGKDVYSSGDNGSSKSNSSESDNLNQ